MRRDLTILLTIVATGLCFPLDLTINEFNAIAANFISSTNMIYKTRSIRDDPYWTLQESQYPLEMKLI